jgi:hypothetical protein
MSSATALIAFLFLSVISLYIISKFATYDITRKGSVLSSATKNQSELSIAAIVTLVLTSFTSIFLSTYNLNSFAVDYDSMSVQLNFLIKHEVKFQMWGGRFFPLSHVDNAFVLKIFKSFVALKVYLIIHFVALLTIAYLAFDFIPKNKRLVLISLVAISPPIVNIYSSPIYSERNILILLCLSVLFFRLGIRNIISNQPALFLSLTSCFLSLYFKETTILFVVSFWGIIFIINNLDSVKALDFSILKNYLNKPLSNIEPIFLVPCFLWLSSFFLLGGDLNPEYVAKRDNSVSEYIGQNAIELAIIFLMSVVMIVRNKLDLYAALFLACLPMALYSLFVIKSLGAYNVFTYYNYLIYVAFCFFVVSQENKKFLFFTVISFIIFTLVTISGFIRFTERVEKREEIVRQAIESLKFDTLNIALSGPWVERNIARFILFTANQGHINHLTKHELFCKDKNLYDENTTCSVGVQNKGCKTLTNLNTTKEHTKELRIIEHTAKDCL